jgi:GTP-binding protein
MAMLDESAVSFQVVLIKADKVKTTELEARLEGVARELAAHVAAHPVIHVTSAHGSTGIAELRAALAGLASG